MNLVQNSKDFLTRLCTIHSIKIKSISMSDLCIFCTRNNVPNRVRVKDAAEKKWKKLSKDKMCEVIVRVIVDPQSLIVNEPKGPIMNRKRFLAM